MTGQPVNTHRLQFFSIVKALYGEPGLQLEQQVMVKDYVNYYLVSIHFNSCRQISVGLYYIYFPPNTHY